MLRAACLFAILLIALPLTCFASFSERKIHLQGRVINPLDRATQPRRLRSDGRAAEFIVQLQPPLSRNKIEQVEKATKLKFIDDVRIPHHSLLVVATPEQVAALEAHPLVLWVGNFLAEYKYPASLSDWQKNVLANSKEAEIVVVLHSMTSIKAAERIVNSWKASIKVDLSVDMVVKPITRVDRAHVVVQASKFFATVQWLSHKVGTLWIEPALQMRPFANRATGIVESGVAGAANIIHANGVTGGSPVEIVSLADSGLDLDSCFLNQTGTPTDVFNPNLTKVTVYATAGGDNQPSGDHGTAMAGLIAGDPEDPVSQYRGLAPGARLAFTDISSDPNGAFTGPVDPLSPILSMSSYGSNIFVGAYGSTAPVTWYTTTDRDFDAQIVQNDRLLVIFAAGNFGQTSGNTNLPGMQLASPAMAKNVLAVGASQNEAASVIAANASLNALYTSDPSQFGQNVLAPFSSKGPSPDGRFKPEIVAPGMGIFGASASPCGVNAGASGTSYAAALVGGAAALVRSYMRGGYAVDGNATGAGINSPSSALVRAALINSGQPLAGYSVSANQFYGTQNQVPHPAYGFGRVQLNQLLYFTGSNPMGLRTIYLDRADESSAIAQGTTIRSCFTVLSSAKPVKVTLAWTDLQGSVVSGIVLTNDLDLLVMDPSGNTYFPNGLNTVDSINNVEQALITTPATGTWTAYVNARYVDSATPGGAQRFAIVISGDLDKESVCGPRCPHNCNGAGSCNTGFCACNAGRFGVDCSLTACPNNCTGIDGAFNGICNPITSQCECTPQFSGVDCRLPANESQVVVVTRRRGLSNGAVAGIAVGLFIAGGLLCGVLGFVAAIQYLIWKRNQHKKLLEEGGKK